MSSSIRKRRLDWPDRQETRESGSPIGRLCQVGQISSVLQDFRQDFRPELINVPEPNDRPRIQDGIDGHLRLSTRVPPLDLVLSSSRVISLGVIVHRGKTFGGGLEELRRTLAAAGYADPIWYEVAKSSKAHKAVRKVLDKGAKLLFVWGGDGMVQR
jgi:hypothetical protein